MVAVDTGANLTPFMKQPVCVGHCFQLRQCKNPQKIDVYAVLDCADPSPSRADLSYLGFGVGQAILLSMCGMQFALCDQLHPFDHVHETAQSHHRTEEQQRVMHFR